MKIGMKTAPSRRAARIGQARVSEAVHNAVCRVTGSEGEWRCLHYSHAAIGLLSHLGLQPVIEAGDLEILGPGGRVVKRLAYSPWSGPEHFVGHVWIGLGGKIVDFSTRHFKTYAGVPLESYAPYLWGNTLGLARYTSVEAASLEAAVPSAVTMDLWAEAINLYERRRVYRVEHFGYSPLGYGSRVVRV